RTADRWSPTFVVCNPLKKLPCRGDVLSSAPSNRLGLSEELCYPTPLRSSMVVPDCAWSRGEWATITRQRRQRKRKARTERAERARPIRDILSRAWCTIRDAVPPSVNPGESPLYYTES